MAHNDEWWHDEGYHEPQPPDDVTSQCEFCTGDAVGFVLVSVNVHPDQRVIVCADHGDFVCSLNADFAAIDWWNEACEKFTLGGDADV